MCGPVAINRTCGSRDRGSCVTCEEYRQRADFIDGGKAFVRLLPSDVKIRAIFRQNFSLRP
jgi:hypothetical protein